MTRQRLAAFLVIALALTASGARAVDTDISVSATAIDFGSVNVGATATVSVTLTNTGGDPFGPINMFGGAPPSAEFNASQNCQAQTLPAGGSCSVTYSFTPTALGSFTDLSGFTISETASQSDGEDFNISLAGIGCDLICAMVVDPASPDPSDPDPSATSPLDGELTGRAKLKGKQLKVRQPYTLQLSSDVAAGTFLAMDANGAVYAGHVVAKGKKGKKFRLFLDDASQSALAGDIATRAAAASGRSAGGVLGKTSELVLKVRKNGSLALRIKLELVDSALGEIVFDAKLAGAAVE